MAKSTIYFQDRFEGLPDEMEADLIQILTSGPENPSFKPDLEDNQKRWLIVGICLQSVITPSLRTYIEPYILRQYNSLKQSKRIDKQTFNKYMPGTPSYGFNYEAINNNAALPRFRGREQRFNYNVSSHVDFSKLFVATNMSQCTAFDATIDLSALLGIIINMDGFPQILKTIAKEVRSNVRNMWAHCNVYEWDALQYQSAFQKMFQLIKHLNLNPTEESELSAELTKWEANGFQFLQGYALGREVVTELRQHTSLLIDYVLKKNSETEENFSKVHSNLVQIDQELNIACKIIEDIKREQKHQEEAIGLISEEVSIIGESIPELKTTQHSLEKRLDSTSSDVRDVAKNQDALRLEQNTTSRRVTSLEEKVHLSDEQLQSLHNDIKGLRNYMSHTRPEKLFFYPPGRTECFVSRERELMVIEYRFNQNDNLLCTQVICGLGGCGKTTLSVEFAWRCQEMYPGGVFWMSAESSESLEDSVALLAIDVNTTGKNSQETLRKTLKWLSSVSEKWLLVVDNADEETFSRQSKELLFGSWKRESKGHFIITTRRERKEVENSMLIKHEDILCLNTLNCEEGATFLRKRTGLQVSENDDDITTIVDELGGLPLALEQAAAHIKSLGCSFGEYIRRFQKKRLKLLKAMPTIAQISQERLTVKTTWQLNIDYICEESENEGIGTAAKTVMDITSFLFSDDIPIELLNIGNPMVEDADLVEALEDQDSTVGLKQIVEILTRFSLFQSFRSETLSVHRLVQEVIRDSLDLKRKSIVLKMAARMINFALNHNDTPYKILRNDDTFNIRRGALYMWSKIAMNANTLKEHLVKVSRQTQSELDICFNMETINILQTTAIFHSLHQRQDRALADQEQMSLIIPSLDIDEEEYRKVTSVTIPLQLKDRKRIQECLVSVIQNAEKSSSQGIIPLDSETLRLKGNDAFINGRYQEALQYYKEGIIACPKNNIDCKILANRSQLYIRIGQYENALIDANKCIEIAPDNYNAYVSKAYAVAELINCGHLPRTWEGVGLASASVAGYINKACLLKSKMKISYPVVNYVMVDHQDLAKEFMTGTFRPLTTFMLRKGRYDLKNIFLTPKSFQVIGVEDGVEIDLGFGMQIRRPPNEFFTIDIKIEKEIQIHFENVFFLPEGGQICVNNSCRTTFYKCKFSNGEKGCEAFPKCRGESGCINPSKCKDAWQKKIMHFLGSNATGQVGYAGLCVANGGKAYVHSCIFERCGGGGVLSCGDGSLIEIKNCIVQNMRQMGIEARDGGAIKAENNVIIKNQTHGVSIGPRGFGYVVRNTIQGNGQEGIWCGGIVELEFEGNQESQMMNSKEGSNATIIDNVISQNGLSGLSFDGGCYYIKGNRIFENWLWGMMVKSRSSCYILNNDIFENKSGGIRVGVNYSASVLIDGNTIRDHTGPAVYALYAPIHYPFPELKPINEIHMQVGDDDETFKYSRAVMKTNTNVLRNNEKGVQHPKTLIDFIKKCCYCHELSNKLKQCSKCKKASYCSKDCQSKHWKRHKHICKLLQESYIIEIKMANTKPVTEEKYGEVNLRMFDHKLKGIREGPAPDKTTSKKFIVKIQSGKEYSFYDPHTEMMLYDRSVTLDIMFSNPVLYHLANECGVLAGSKFTTKKIFCWASFKDKGKILCIHTDNLPPFQTW